MAEPIDVHKVFAEYFPDIEPWAYGVSEALSDGSICIQTDKYQEDIENGIKKNPFLKEGEELVTETLINSKFVSKDLRKDLGKELKPFVLENDRLYMHRYYCYQTKIVEKTEALITAEKRLIHDRMVRLEKMHGYINDLFSKENNVKEIELSEMERIDWQKVAALNACLNNFTIITGGPGTGKTTTVARILAILYNQDPDLKVALAAPTGKAAARLSESLRQAIKDNPPLANISEKIEQIVPKTIHRLLETIPQSTLFRHNAENPLEHDLVIIDEASMIDGALMFKLMDSIRPEKKIIFLGDRNQLASVEAGSIFGDLCRTQGEYMNYLDNERLDFCNKFLEFKITGNLVSIPDKQHLLSHHIIQLHRNYRTESKDISHACRLIIENQKDELMALLTSDKHPAVNYDIVYNEEMLDSMALKYLLYIDSEDVVEALKNLKMFRVLCAVREGKHGIYQINRKIERLLKSRINSAEKFNPSGTFYHNQAIMVTSNNYDLDVFNGDTGLIRRKSDTDNTLVAYFESSDPKKPKEILPGYLNDWETVYAMTIHKSQGSEFDSVAVILPENENTRILTRELLYTAVSRARKEVLIQSPVNVLMATTDREVSRASGIADQF
jgi:exodeoxyribonuclease V alpha subunit